MDVFIVTRFSLRIGGWIERIGVNEEEREEWFRYRAEIFRQTALPAVKRQTYEIKQYFLLLDVGDESLYYSCLGDSEEVTPLFCVASEANQLLETKIQAQTKDPTLVARLDSDDLIADNYVENLVFCTNKKFVQDRAKKEKVIFLKAPNGYRMDWKWMQEIKIENPPFLASFYSQFRPPLDLGGGSYKNKCEKSDRLQRCSLGSICAW